MDSNESNSSTPRDHRYDQQDYLTFIAFVSFDREIGSDCNSDFDDSVSILDNLCEECKHLLNNCIKVTTIYELQKNLVC